jgi:hypothetical protein
MSLQIKAMNSQSLTIYGDHHATLLVNPVNVERLGYPIVLQPVRAACKSAARACSSTCAACRSAAAAYLPISRHSHHQLLQSAAVGCISFDICSNQHPCLLHFLHNRFMLTDQKFGSVQLVIKLTQDICHTLTWELQQADKHLLAVQVAVVHQSKNHIRSPCSGCCHSSLLQHAKLSESELVSESLFGMLQQAAVAAARARRTDVVFALTDHSHLHRQKVLVSLLQFPCQGVADVLCKLDD